MKLSLRLRKKIMVEAREEVGEASWKGVAEAVGRKSSPRKGEAECNTRK